ncbi:MAG: ankyrin repeat domain-containing protein [Planctomycetes bacterium]|nr:ankyrin repeat domain-containing protein [Planctomycetota bacterium]
MPHPAGQEDDLLAAIETHDVEALERAVAGRDAGLAVRGKTPVHWLLEMYLRSDRFAPCLRVLLAHGGRLDDPWLRAVLLDDAAAVRAQVAADAGVLERRLDLTCAFTPLLGSTALHVAAEFGHVDVVRELVAAGADVDARARAEADGDGHTPLFHTVASILDHAAPVLHLLLAAGARTDVTVRQMTWGRGFDWETTLFDVTPLSYCQAGLLPQMHRREADVWRNVRALLAAGGRPVPPLPNVPNRYLQPRPR